MIIAWVYIGFLVSWLFGILTNSDGRGAWANLIFGISGAIVGGALEYWIWKGSFVIIPAYQQFNLLSLLFALIGSSLFLGILLSFRNLLR